MPNPHHRRMQGAKSALKNFNLRNFLDYAVFAKERFAKIVVLPMPIKNQR